MYVFEGGEFRNIDYVALPYHFHIEFKLEIFMVIRHYVNCNKKACRLFFGFFFITIQYVKSSAYRPSLTLPIFLKQKSESRGQDGGLLFYIFFIFPVKKLLFADIRKITLLPYF